MATASNQDQLNEVTDELVRSVQDILLAALGTINIGEEQRIGLLAAIDDLATAPIGDLQALLVRLTLANVAGRDVVGGAGALMAQGAYGPGGASPIATDFFKSSDFNDFDVPNGDFTVAGHWLHGPLGDAGHTGVVSIRRRSFNNFVMQTFNQSGFGLPVYERFGNPSSDTWEEWSRVIKQNNLVGTVSQTGGVPTGAVIERGSNSDGSYVKLADGTMFCWATVLLRVGDYLQGKYDMGNKSLPRLFSSPPTVTAAVGVSTVSERLHGVYQVEVRGTTADWASFWLIAGAGPQSSDGQTLLVNLHATGVWY